MSVSSYSFNSVIPPAQSFIIVILASDHLPLRTTKCCSVVVTLRLLDIHFVVVSRQKQTPSLTSERLVSSTRWSVTAECHSTPSSQILAHDRDFSLPHRHSTPPLRWTPYAYRHKVWYGKTRIVRLPDGEKFRRYLYSFRQNVQT